MLCQQGPPTTQYADISTLQTSTSTVPPSHDGPVQYADIAPHEVRYSNGYIHSVTYSKAI